MKLQTLICKGIEPALAFLPRKMDSSNARVLTYAIALQESALLYRRQMGNGPARSFWQMERGGGVYGVLAHYASRDLAKRLCEIRGVKANSRDVWNAIEHDDVLAAGFARLLLWTDTQPLPAVGDAKGGWNYYMRTWRPGAHMAAWKAGTPHPDKWTSNHAAARLQLASEEL